MKTIDDIARRRRTIKLLPDPADPLPGGGASRALVEALVATAGQAPFHRASAGARAGQCGAVEPWRMHMLDAPACRALIPTLDTLSKPPAKIANMLAAAEAMILATWLPEPNDNGWEATDINMEHIAAGSAAVQTLLLAATEAGFETYWSSGGSLATSEAFDLLDIPRTEVFLGAIFLFPDVPEGVEAAPGKLREHRTAPENWSRWVTVPHR